MSDLKPAIVVIPRAPGSDSPPLRANLEKVYVALGRIEEVALLTSFKAPELLSTFNKAYLDLGRWSMSVLLEKSRAKAEMERIQATIVLDDAPRILAEKKVRESDATRQAVVELNVNYRAARDCFDNLVAIHEMFKHHLKTLEMAYTSAKKILGEHNPNLIDQRVLLNGAGNEPDEEDGQYRSVFGVPRN